MLKITIMLVYIFYSELLTPIKRILRENCYSYRIHATSKFHKEYWVVNSTKKYKTQLMHAKYPLTLLLSSSQLQRSLKKRAFYKNRWANMRRTDRKIRQHSGQERAVESGERNPDTVWPIVVFPDIFTRLGYCAVCFIK